MSAPTSARGFRDVLPVEAERMTRLEAEARAAFRRYGYREVRLPTVELKELFVKSTGATSDIVEKEMFEWEDQGGRRLALRPEATPGIARLYVSENLQQKGRAQRLFTIGSMFRAERPQKGRYREFEQVDAECIGIEGPEADAELILLLAGLADKAGVKDYRVRLNTLGDEAPDCRPAFRERLRAFLRERKAALCEPCQARIEKNPLRALDCKRDGPALKADAPRLAPCAPCAEHYAAVKGHLADAGFKRTVEDPHLVRGLDYYTRTVFEFSSESLGAQDAFAAGGRYDRLIKSMGGPDVPAVGWAMGVERTLLAAGDDASRRPLHTVFTVVQKDTPELRSYAMSQLQALRAGDLDIVASGASFGSSFKAQMREANQQGADYVVIVGESELASGSVTLKPFKDEGEQRTVPAGKLWEALKKEIQGP